MSDIITNCGNLTPTTYETMSFGGGPDIQQGHIPYFHSMLCQWAYTVAQSFSFVVVIEIQSKSNLISKIKNSLRKLEPPGWNTEDITHDTWANATQNVVGCIFAQGARIPGESIGIDHVGITEGSRRGFINAPIINGRADFEPLEIGFLETNQSFVDGVIRPWLIIAAHEGLIARENSIKTNISIYQLARANNENQNIVRKNVIRKHWKFMDCVPVNVTDEDLTYDVSGYPKRQVQFVYNSYSLEGTPSIQD